ncbi:acetyl-CoA carboxylase carboxyl transferase subunit alpha [Thermotomaculum hydrothermale]|uniref:Acetyl-coenzyme A carboxylase carboxyl transferase subunit alpha n=1 Tax=Thermotomaculum hydrothermale TaxID=981385 RepID=A0A7R6PNG1_9BACT|nr:acetyl-CoA carboxylase carboxyltransferase subunit alpha [Thermotomaculum hydrothermale]BBB32301.1 acetyl-CoA carboxylase carboxyl transferase subunit alpha [Thermotomaculum hydrothermale]
MGLYFLPFEKELVNYHKKLETAETFGKENEIKEIKAKIEELRKKIYKNLDEWQIALVARHPNRPYFLDYVERIFSDFIELHGDRNFGDDKAIVGGFAFLDDIPVCIIGQQKGRDTKEKIYRNFGMPKPEGYRKALRIMKMAEKFKRPIITFVDTPGAYPGIDAEERGQAEAIARNLLEMSKLRVPVITVIIGEGGSGGALGIAVANRVLMLEYSIYSVISPEGCASILWKDAAKADEAARALKFTANHLKKYGIVDEIVPEPIGGAHVDYDKTAEVLKEYLLKNLESLNSVPVPEIVNDRYLRFRRIGEFQEVKA